VEDVIEACPSEIIGLHTQEALNILPLGSYDVLLDMDWLGIHKEKLNYNDKTFEYEYEEGNSIVL
jgi:hypothetical protein